MKEIAVTFLYAIRAAGTEFVKLGKADDPYKRLAELQCGQPHQLFIQATKWVASAQAERELHRAVSDSHFRGEWFRYTTEVETAIADWPRAEMGAVDSALNIVVRLKMRIGALEAEIKKLKAEDECKEAVRAILSAQFRFNATVSRCIGDARSVFRCKTEAGTREMLSAILAKLQDETESSVEFLGEADAEWTLGLNLPWNKRDVLFVQGVS